jgi:hypothetical protein
MSNGYKQRHHPSGIRLFMAGLWAIVPDPKDKTLCNSAQRFMPLCTALSNCRHAAQLQPIETILFFSMWVQRKKEKNNEMD